MASMRRVAFILVLLVLVAAFAAYWWNWPRTSTGISTREVAGVSLQAVPEGPGAGFGRGFPPDRPFSVFGVVLDANSGALVVEG